MGQATDRPTKKKHTLCTLRALMLFGRAAAARVSSPRNGAVSVGSHMRQESAQGLLLDVQLNLFLEHFADMVLALCSICVVDLPLPAMQVGSSLYAKALLSQESGC